jgi:hypothetical protein
MCWNEGRRKAVPANEARIWKCLTSPDQYVKSNLGSMTDQQMANAVATDFAEGFSSMSLANLDDAIVFRATENPSFYGAYSSPGANSYPDSGPNAYGCQSIGRRLSSTCAI